MSLIVNDMQQMLAEHRELSKSTDVESAIRLQLLTGSIIASIPALIAVMTADLDHLSLTLAWLTAHKASPCHASQKLAGPLWMMLSLLVEHTRECPVEQGATRHSTVN